MFGDVDPEYFEKTILPLLQYRIPGKLRMDTFNSTRDCSVFTSFQLARHFKSYIPIHNSTLQSKIDGHVFVLRKSNWIDADSDPNPYPDLGQEHFFKIY